MNRLAITRAFGDFEFKTIHLVGETQRREYLTCYPEIRMIELDPFTDDFIAMGSDGLFDKFSSQEVVNFIKNKLVLNPTGEQIHAKIAKELANEVIYTKMVKDNVTIIIVALNRGVGSDSLK